MALFPIHKYFLFNGVLKPVSEFVPSENEGGIYEVLRVVNGVPLFLDEHLQRFYHSAEIAGKNIVFSEGDILSMLKDLIDKNDVEFGNILISCKTNLKSFFIPHKYPLNNEYLQGVNCGILHAERENPNAKVFQTSVRQQANEQIAEHNFYEVLLVDNKGKITEGSRSNVFFVKDGRIITPKAKKVLLGITRQKTIQCAKELGFDVLEQNVELDKLEGFDAVFLTGTSPKLLPVKYVDKLQFNTANEVLRKLMLQFNAMIESYVNTKLP